jgi:multicomponent Na+:H+ antiporter subunit B
MNPILLKTASRHLGPLLVALSLLVLYRGHNLPGGGFIGGLLAASAVVLYALSDGIEAAERKLPLGAVGLMALGLCIAGLSGLPGLLAGDPFMAGRWLPALEAPLIGKIKLGTPVLFDVGVYLTVIGFITKCALALGAHSATWKS